MDEERLPPYDAVLQRPESSEHEKLEYVVIDVEDTGLLEGSGGTIVLHCDISPSRPSMQLYHTFRNLDYATLIALAELTSDMAEETGVVQAEELDKMPTDSEINKVYIRAVMALLLFCSFLTWAAMSTQGFERWLTQFCDAFYGNLGGNLLGFFVGNFILSGRSREKINLSKVFCKACFVYLLMAIMTATVRLNTMEEQQRHLRLEKAAGLS